MRKFGIVVLVCLLLGGLVGGGLVFTGKNKEVVSAIKLVQISPSDKTSIEQTAVMTIPTNASAGTQAKATVKQYDGTRAYGTVDYGKASPSANFVAIKDGSGSWTIEKTDVKYDGTTVVKTNSLKPL